MSRLLRTLLACCLLASAALAGDPTYSIPSQSGFNHDFALRIPGDVLNLNVVPDPGVTNLTGKVDNGSSAGWAGGPKFTCTIPATFAGVHLGKFSGTYTIDGAGGGKPPTWAGAAKSSVLRLTHVTVATTPANRDRLTVGVGEEVDIGTDPATTVAWAVAGGGALSSNNGATTRYTAPGAAATSTITATLAAGRTLTLSLTVIPPSGAVMTAAAPFYHVRGRPSAGFTANPIVIQPTTVSFYRIQVDEGVATVAATGVFAIFNGVKHAKGPFVGVNQANNVLGTDTIRTTGTTAGAPAGDLSGTLTWPIPWFYRIVGDGGDGTEFATLTHAAVSDQAGTTTQSKGGASKTFALNDPNAP